MTPFRASRLGRANPFPAGPRGGAACNYCSTGLRGISAQYLPLLLTRDPRWTSRVSNSTIFPVPRERRIPLVRTSSKSAARRQPRPPARGPRERVPNGHRSWGDPREGPGARPESPPPTADHIPPAGPPSTRRRTPPRGNPPPPTPRRRGHGPREAGRAPRFRRRRGEGDGATAPPAAARAQPRFAPQPDRPSP
ncbi:hypothetical protein CRENBAI_019766 [Crenichthys baileyi]|uniref:Basic proline-rich protein-like n=1 Tax=Crenichthys baileyi TaxID=28760 RepID=A0AAV9SNQ1_9TELE